MIVAQYATYEVMHGHKSSLAQLIEKLRPFSRESVIYLCTVIGMVLKLWQRGGWDQTHYDQLVADSFDPLRGDWYRASARSKDPELVFHRRQLLLLMKLAIEHCGDGGMDLLNAPRHHFGTILLMASDQFHHGLYPFPDGADIDEEDKLTRVLAEFVPVAEYGGFRVENLITRSHLMMTRYAPRLQGHSDYIDIAGEYERLSGVSLTDYEALVFGLFARCSTVTLNDLRSNAWVAAVRDQNFHATDISKGTISCFLAGFSATPAELKTGLAGARERRRDFGVNDFTIFRDKPLIAETYGRLPTDLLFVAEKFASGPYWRLNSTSREFGDRLRRFWGAVFEVYVNEQVSASAKQAGAIFVPDPRLSADPAVQLCDGILVAGDALVLLEYKSSMFTAQAKYAGNHVLLRNEIITKLVRDVEEGKKKGVEQLAVATKQLFEDKSKMVVEGLNLTQIRTVYPLLITLDEIGGTLLISRLLNRYLDQFLDRTKITSVDVRPLVCTDIESLEMVLPYSDIRPLSSFIQYWLDSDNRLASTLLAFTPLDLPVRRNEVLHNEWKRLCDSIGSKLFPVEHAAAKARTEQK